MPFLALIAKEDPTMRKILCHKGVNTIGLAEKFPEVLRRCTGLELYAMLRHAHILFMNWFDTPRMSLIKWKGERGTMLEPPIVIFADGYTVCGNSKLFAQYLIDFNLSCYPLYYIMLRQEPPLYLADSPMIDEERRKEHWSDLQKVYSNIF
jgi:hypothetical protein